MIKTSPGETTWRRYQTHHSADPPLAYLGLAVRVGSFINAAVMLAVDVTAALAILIPAIAYP